MCVISYRRQIPKCNLYIFVWVQPFWSPSLNRLSETFIMNCLIEITVYLYNMTDVVMYFVSLSFYFSVSVTSILLGLSIDGVSLLFMYTVFIYLQ